MSEDFTDTPRMLSEEEKRQLILAHATSSRTAKDPIQRATVWMGFAAILLAIGWGWWNTVGIRIGSAIKGQPSSYQDMTKNMDAFTTRLRGRAELESPTIPQPTSGAEAGNFSQLMKSVLEPGSNVPTRNDLIAPGNTPLSGVQATSTPVVPPPQPSSMPVIDPSTPGLQMDQ